MPKFGSASIASIADEEISGYYAWVYSTDNTQDPHARFWENDHPGSPTVITVNISELQGDEQTLAIQALQTWADVANITFAYTTGTADITYTDVDDGGHAVTHSTTFYDGLTDRLWMTGATVHVPRNWADGVGAGDGSYFFQTLVHETGHALGLGHSGNYNGGTTNQYYNTDSTLYANDTWQWSIMSYNDQAQFGGTDDYVLTPEMADINAIQRLYGAATTRTGDTTYGFNSNAGSLYDFSRYGHAPAFTIYDSGGTDTIDASGYSVGQHIDLEAGSWSSIGGETNNVGINVGVTIENAIGGSGADGIVGNDGSNVLKGGAGNDQLDGLGGVDTYYGGAGDDQFEVRNAADIIIENPGEGIDRYDSYVSIDALPANVENIVLYGATDLYAIANNLANVIDGSNGNNNLYGLGGKDTIKGWAGDDWIDGGAGADTMVGGTGDDVYQVDNALDVVIENPGEGTDQVDSYLTYTLGANVENLVLYGTVKIDGTGNALANTLNGNNGDNILHGLAGHDTLYGYAGDDTLDGGTGVDAMIGGVGDDTYYVDDARDKVTELVGQGSDTVYASVSWTMAAGQEIESLRAYGAAETGGVTLGGNDLANTLVGGSGHDSLSGGGGADTLNGRAGADIMDGGAGNDIYFVDNVADQVEEAVGGGVDTVNASTNWTMTAGQSIEFLRLSGAAATQGASLTGNALANSLIGGSGADTLDGKGGKDKLTGQGGNDTFRFDTTLGASNVDTIVDFNGAADKIDLSHATFTGLSMGVLSGAEFALDHATGSGPEVVYNHTTGALYFDTNGAAAGGSTEFAILAGAQTLAAARIFVV